MHDRAIHLQRIDDVLAAHRGDPETSARAFLTVNERNAA